jgi:hypothetical protein
MALLAIPVSKVEAVLGATLGISGVFVVHGE